MKNAFFISKNNSWSNNLFSQIKSVPQTSWIRIDEENWKDFLKFSQNKYIKDKNDFLFFFHWSLMIPSEIYEHYNCVSFHTSNLPEGKGGSPIQNQILEGTIQTHLNALKTSKIIDGGEIFCREPLSLQGNLRDIWNTISNLAFKMISNIIENDIKPVPQKSSNSKIFKRLKNNKIDFEKSKSINEIYDKVRMLDADGYENANIKIGNFRLDFSRAKLENGEVLVDARIKYEG